MDPSIELSYVTELGSSLINYLKDLVVKREDLANKYETLESSRAYDEYISALTKTDTFEGYEYTDEIYQQAGLTEDEIRLAKVYKMNVPPAKREACLLIKRAQILSSYVETNNYYRMLMGLPAMDDTQYIYITDDISGVDKTKPLHEMNNDEISILTSLGYIDRFIKQFPNKPYLKYLGSKKIDHVFARSAKKFDILRSGSFEVSAIKKRFEINYEISKNYILNNYYKKRMALDQQYYDAYIGFIILLNSIIMTVNDSIDIFNFQEYYNELMVKQILQSYDLNIYDDIPLSYRKEVANNINSLIISKGTDEVIFKIFKLFGFDNVTVKKYYLVKEHKKDSNGDYIFEYDEQGNPKYDKMYDISFSSVDITSDNIDAEIRKPENKLAYSDVVMSDIYWGGYESDDEIKNKLLREDFNYIDTDYVSIGTAYFLADIVTEMSYTFTTALAIKDYIKNLTFIEPIFGFTVDVFYVLTMLAALISKKAGFLGNIVTDPANLAYLYKFNFDRNLQEIENIMKKYNYNGVASEYLLKRPTAELQSPAALVSLYFDNKEIYSKLLELRYKTKNLNEYLAVKELIDYLTKSKLLSDVYKKRNGQIASTYIDYLADTNQTIADYIDNLSVDEIDSVAFKILTSLEDYFRTDRFTFLFLKVPTLSGENSLKRYMLKVINTFKAFTINILSLTITYAIDDKNNFIKTIDTVKFDGAHYPINNISTVDTLGILYSETKRTDIKLRDEIEIIG
mgnify:CR=1 FL=1